MRALKGGSAVVTACGVAKGQPEGDEGAAKGDGAGGEAGKGAGWKGEVDER